MMHIQMMFHQYFGENAHEPSNPEYRFGVTQIVAKYSIDKAQAQSDVDAVMKGRQI